MINGNRGGVGESSESRRVCLAENENSVFRLGKSIVHDATHDVHALIADKYCH